jgi:hypothetical protein
MLQISIFTWPLRGGYGAIARPCVVEVPITGFQTPKACSGQSSWLQYSVVWWHLIGIIGCVFATEDPICLRSGLILGSQT